MSVIRSAREKKMENSIMEQARDGFFAVNETAPRELAGLNFKIASSVSEWNPLVECPHICIYIGARESIRKISFLAPAAPHYRCYLDAP